MGEHQIPGISYPFSAGLIMGFSEESIQDWSQNGRPFARSN